MSSFLVVHNPRFPGSRHNSVQPEPDWAKRDISSSRFSKLPSNCSLSCCGQVVVSAWEVRKWGETVSGSLVSLFSLRVLALDWFCWPQQSYLDLPNVISNYPPRMFLSGFNSNSYFFHGILSPHGYFLFWIISTPSCTRILSRRKRWKRETLFFG